MLKPFFTSDSLYLDRDFIETNSLIGPNTTFVRTCAIVKARPGSEDRDILSEVQEIENRLEKGENYKLLQGRVLVTTITEYDDIIVALTYQGFESASYSFGGLRTDRYASLAKELVYLRDWDKK